MLSDQWAFSNSISMNSLNELNEFMAKAIKAGGKEYREPQDLGFMQLRCFEDLDGHSMGSCPYGFKRSPAAVKVS